MKLKLFFILSVSLVMNAIASVEAVEITPLQADYQIRQQEPIKSYKDFVDVAKVCNSRQAWNNTSGTGIEAMKTYKKINDCERRVNNRISMSKTAACMQPDGFYNTMLQFNWYFNDQKGFSSTNNEGFYKMGNYLYYQIHQRFYASDSKRRFFYRYDCINEKAKEIKGISGYISDYSHYKDTLMFSVIRGLDFIEAYEIGTYKDQKFSFLDIANFSGFDSIYPAIQEHAKNHDISGVPDKGHYSNPFRDFDIQNIDPKNGEAKLIITMPGFQLTYTIDIFKKSIK